MAPWFQTASSANHEGWFGITVCVVPLSARFARAALAGRFVYAIVLPFAQEVAFRGLFWDEAS